MTDATGASVALGVVVKLGAQSVSRRVVHHHRFYYCTVTISREFKSVKISIQRWSQD